MMNPLSRALLAVCALPMAFAVASCGSPDAFLEVTVPVDPALKIDQVRFTFTAPETPPKILTAPDPAQDFTDPEISVGVILPAEFAGVELTVGVEAFAGGAANGVLVGTGSGTVTTAAGKLATLTVDLELAFTCGDGAIESVEECDDGNTAAGDGCAASCVVEPTYTCSGEPSVCVLCGDGSIDGIETCDDGNATAGDGCDATCGVEEGFECTGAPSTCAPVCGDGFLRGDEACDDGGVVEGDGCDAACGVEDGWTCDAGEPTACAPVCGDGVILGDEACDDDGVTPGDGCDAACFVESGWACAGAPSVCTEGCGDGDIVGSEACDDGALLGGDGCSAACAIEAGYTCTGEPSVCATACGDGLLAGTEDCDDGDTANGDGCDDACAVEPGWACAGDPSVCAPVCGDGTLIAAIEACDDGDQDAGDGCDAACAVENGFTCAGAPSACSAICGDGIVAGPESQAGGCDDGNPNPNDGCDNCVEEPGFDCTGTPSTCATDCGDGVQAGLELCDDGAGNGDTPNACRFDCTLPVCGDTIIDDGLEFGEGCDDGGNTDNTDGCRTGCRAPACGDGFLDTGAPNNETCDDGNNAPGDGCSAGCAIEGGSQCGGIPSLCADAVNAHVVAPAGGDFTTLAAAETAAAAGDLVIVRAGTYTSVTIDKDLRVVGEPGAIIESSANNITGVVVVSGGANVTLQGLTIQRNGGNGKSTVVVTGAGSSVTIVGSTLGPSTRFGVEQIAGTTVEVRRSTITGNTSGGLDLTGAFVVENSVLRDNGIRGAGFQTGATGAFRFNTVTANPVGVACNNGQTRTPVTSSIVFGNTTNVQTAANCDTATSLLTDPDFVAANDHHVNAGSPAVDAAGLVDCPAEDFDNDARPINAACDIGADERP